MFPNACVACDAAIWHWWSKHGQSELWIWRKISFKHQIVSIVIFIYDIILSQIINYLSTFSKFFICTSNKGLFIMTGFETESVFLYNCQVNGDSMSFPLVSEFEINIYIVKFLLGKTWHQSKFDLNESCYYSSYCLLFCPLTLWYFM